MFSSGWLGGITTTRASTAPLFHDRPKTSSPVASYRGGCHGSCGSGQDITLMTPQGRIRTLFSRARLWQGRVFQLRADNWHSAVGAYHLAGIFIVMGPPVAPHRLKHSPDAESGRRAASQEAIRSRCNR